MKPATVDRHAIGVALARVLVADLKRRPLAETPVKKAPTEKLKLVRSKR